MPHQATGHLQVSSTSQESMLVLADPQVLSGVAAALAASQQAVPDSAAAS